MARGPGALGGSGEPGAANPNPNPEPEPEPDPNPNPNPNQVLYAAQEIASAAGCEHTCFQVEDVGTYDKTRETCFRQYEAPAIV